MTINNNLLAKEINSETLREFLNYDPNTGLFTQIKKTHSRDNRRKLNAVLGRVDAHGYISFSFLGKKHKAHRLAWFWVNGSWPENQIDHINGDRTDNRISNLRIVDNSQNQANRRVIKSLSGFKGVYPNRDKNDQIVSWDVQYNKVYLGTFKSPVEGAAAYDKYISKIHGEFAATNQDILNG